MTTAAAVADLSAKTANGVPEGDAVSEDDLTTVGEAWFAAVG